MATKLPYMLSPGLIPKIFERIASARRPERFTQDFLETKLGHGGGSARAIIPLLKRMGMMESDGSPTSLYDQYRNTNTQQAAIAAGMRNAYTLLFDKNEYANNLSRDKLTSLVVEVTGGAKDDSVVQKIVGTFWMLRGLADFDDDGLARPTSDRVVENDVAVPPPQPSGTASNSGTDQRVDLRVGYTINLNLPETADPNVFNAIFRALRDNLLRN